MKPRLLLIISLFVCTVSALLCLAGPANDNFADRATISGAGGTANGNNVGATHEVDEPWILSWIVNGTNSVWWTWTCPTSGLYGFDTFGSTFNTALGIFTGNILSNLAKLTYSNYAQFFNGSTKNNGYVRFQATAGEIYQVSVAGSTDDQEGNIMLNWYLDTLVAYSNVVVTNQLVRVYPAPNGSLLHAHGAGYSDVDYKTNVKEVVVSSGEYETSYTNVTVVDRKGRTLVDVPTFSEISGKTLHFHGFDGKRILVDEQGMSGDDYEANLHLYAVTRKGLKHVNAYYVSNNFGNAFLSRKWIYVYITDWSYLVDRKLIALNKTLKKAAWQFKPALYRGGFFPVYPNGVAVYRQWDPTTDFYFEIGKKGKPYATHTLISPSTGYVNWANDNKGGLLIIPADGGTNGPMTYVDRKGKPKVLGFVPDNFPLYSVKSFDGRTLVLGRTAGGNSYLQAYKWGKQPKLLGTTTVANYKEVKFADGKLYVITTNGSDIAVSEFDKTLSKTKWQNTGPGQTIEYIDRKVFYRENTNATSRTVTIFRKEKDIATHTVNN